MQRPVCTYTWEHDAVGACVVVDMDVWDWLAVLHSPNIIVEMSMLQQKLGEGLLLHI